MRYESKMVGIFGEIIIFEVQPQKENSYGK
jgi:hypothetical protein